MSDPRSRAGAAPRLLDLLRAPGLDWSAIEAALPFAADMRACMQDSVYHAEGDVWTHTKMVVDQMIGSEGYATLDEDRRLGVLLAALLHDVAKPETREVLHDPDLARERVSHRGHALKGAKAAWAHLWRIGAPLSLREQVFALILWHQRVFHILSQDDPRLDVIRFSAIGRWRELLALAPADALGRTSVEIRPTVENLELTRMLVEECGCLDSVWPFENDEARIRFMRAREKPSAFFTPQPAVGSRVIVLSGLPGSGKDTYAAREFRNIPVISLDAMREKLDIDPGENDGLAVQHAYEAARAHLRARTPFIWNATNLTRLFRNKIIDLCLAYDAFVEIHAIDRSPETTFAQNRARSAVVGDAVIDRMIRGWEPPTLAEAHKLVWVTT